MGFPVNQIRTSCPWTDRTMLEREEDPSCAQLLCWDALRVSRRMVTAPWSWEAGGVSLLAQQRRGQAAERLLARGRGTTRGGAWFLVLDQSPYWLAPLPLVFLPDSWA